MAKRRSQQFQDNLGPRSEAEAIVLAKTDFKKSPIKFIESCLSVVPLQGGTIIPFKLNPGQLLIMQKLEALLRKGEYVRIIVLKSRRQGISTLCEAIMY